MSTQSFKTEFKSFTLLFKVLLHNQNQLAKTKGQTKDGKAKKRLPQSITAALSMTPLLIMMCAMLSFVTLQLDSVSALASLMNSVVSSVQLLTLFIMMFGFTTTLYSSDDTRLLSTLPVRPMTVFASKFALCYVNALSFSSALVLLPLLTMTITYAAAGKPIFYGVIPLSFVIAVLAPVLPLFVVTLLSLPIVWVRSYLKSRGAVNTILSLAFYVVLMVAYLVVVFLFSSNGGQVNVTDQTIAGLQTVSNVMYPNKVLILTCLGIDAGKNFGIFAAILVAAVALTLTLSALFYKRITARSVEATQEKHNGKTSLKRTGIVQSLIRRDFKAVMRTPSIAMSSLSSLLLGPVMIVFLYFVLFKSGSNGADVGTTMTGLSGELLMMAIVVVYTNMMCGSSNMLSMMAFSREGKSFLIMKTLPLSVKDVIKAKFAVAVIPIAVCLAVNMIICATLLKCNVMSVLMYGFTSFVFCAGATAFNIYFDIKHGNVNWTSAAEMQMERKRNTATLLPVLTSMIPGILLMIPTFLLTQYESAISAYGVRAVYWSIALLCGIVECVVGFVYLKEKGIPLYPKIGENTFAIKSSTNSINNKRGGLFGGGGNNMLG